MPRVSVICAAYNGEAFLPETLASLKGQTESDFEVIVVDDASTDGTADLLAKMDDPRFRSIRNALNRHVVFSRNRAIESAIAPYIAVTDQDDLSSPDRLRLQADMLDRHPGASAVYSLIRSIDEFGKPVRATSDWRYSGEEAKAALLFHNFITHSALMFRRACATDPVYPEEYPLCEDYNLIAHLAYQGEGIVMVNERLVDYRYHSTNYTRSGASRMTELSRRLRRGLLAKLGVVATDSEMDLHDAFEKGVADPDVGLMNRLKEWLAYLEDANVRSGLIARTEFHRVVSNEWLELSQKFSHLGHVAWQIYRAGPCAVSLGQRPSVVSFWVKTHR